MSIRAFHLPAPPLQYAIAVVLAIIIAQPADLCAQSGDKPAADSAADTPNPLKRRPKNPLKKRQKDPFVGSFKNSEITITIDGRPDAFTGHILQGDLKMSVAARRDGDNLVGAFKYKDTSFSFTAKLVNGKLVLNSEGEVYNLTRATPQTTDGAKPPTNPSPPTAGAFTRAPQTKPPSLSQVLGSGDGPGADDVLMDTAKHANGLTFRYPRGWRIHKIPNGLAAIPPDVDRGVSGAPAEVFFFHKQSVRDATRASDPGAIAILDEYMVAGYAGMTRQPGVQAIDSLLGEGVVVLYQGTRAGGVEGRARLYAVVHEGEILFLVHAVRSDLPDRRRHHAEHLFATAGWQPGEVDKALFGDWASVQHNGSGPGTAGAVRRWSFKPNGECIWSETRRPEGAANTPPAAADTKHLKGSWSVNRGRLYLAWPGGRGEVLGYEAGRRPTGGTQLTLKRAGQPPIILFKQ